MSRDVALCVAALLMAGCSADALIPDTRLIIGAEIVTMADGPQPDAMLIEKGRITALGPEDMLRARNPGAVLTNLTGKTVLPGFVDSHVHVRELGLGSSKVDLVGVRNMADIVARIRDQQPGLDPKEWIIGQGWDEGAFANSDGPGGYPTTELLSEAFPDTPIALESLHGFAALANDAALERAGIVDDTPDPDGGTILRDDAGKATGVFLTLAQDLLFDAVPELDPPQIEQAILTGLQRLGEAGVTSVHEGGMDARDVAAFQALAERGELPIRVYGLLDGNDDALMAEWFDRGPLDDPQDWLDIGGIKVFYDGSLGSRTALLRAPYSDRPDIARPTARISMAEIEELSKKALESNFQMAVHAIGDLANDNVLNSYERRLVLETDAPLPDHRWRIEHAQVVSAGFFEKAAALNVIASMQPSHAMGDSDWAEDRLGQRRIRRAYAWKSLEAAGVPILFNSDLPGEPWEPMQTLHFATTRTKLDGTPVGGWYVNQALGRTASLRAMTINGARAAFQDENLGSLEIGKWADFVVLSANPMTTPDVLMIEVEATYVAGQRLEPVSDESR